jgi:hypothetical protein
MSGRPRIDVLETPDEVMTKIEKRHNVSYDDVDEVLRGAFGYSWSFEEARGWRLYVPGRARGGKLLKVVLRLVDPLDGVEASDRLLDQSTLVIEETVANDVENESPACRVF